MSRRVKLLTGVGGHRAGEVLVVADAAAHALIRKKQAQGITVLRLLVPYALNNPGEVCGFPDAEAQDMLALGYAEPVLEMPPEVPLAGGEAP